jgi:hypothetical protein
MRMIALAKTQTLSTCPGSFGLAVGIADYKTSLCGGARAAQRFKVKEQNESH